VMRITKINSAKLYWWEWLLQLSWSMLNLRPHLQMSQTWWNLLWLAESKNSQYHTCQDMIWLQNKSKQKLWESKLLPTSMKNKEKREKLN
jgi:hypothetical protein